MERFTKPLATIAVIAFVALGISTLTAQKKLQIKTLQIKTTTSELKSLQDKYDTLNGELEKTDTTNEEKIKQLELEKQQLQEQKAELEKQANAKREAARVAASRLNEAASLSQTAYAAGDAELAAKMFIYNKESGNDPTAINRSSGACGLGQALPCSKMNCSLNDYTCQDKFFTWYMGARYGTWVNAKAFWLSHNWW